MSSFLSNPFSKYMPTQGSQANSASGAPLSLFELMTGKSPDQANPSAGQVPSGPGNPNQGANWMPPMGGMGSPQSQNMPSQGQGMGKNPQPQSGTGAQSQVGNMGGYGGGGQSGGQPSWIPAMPGAGPGPSGGSTVFGQNGVMNGGAANPNSVMGKMGAKGGAVGA